MNSSRRRIRSTIALALALAITPALAGCFGENPLGGIVEQATGGQVDLGGTEIPTGFPSEVPLISGDIEFGLGVGEAESRAYNVTIAAGAESPLATIETQFADAGFESQVQASSADGVGSVVFSNDSWGVVVVVAQTDEGYTANYTVTPAGS